MRALRFRVTGHVQGVGFRNYVVSVAQALGLSGEVWNMRDGAVEGFAEGGGTAKLEPFLNKGPGRVDNVQTWDSEAVGTEGFTIGPTR